MLGKFTKRTYKQNLQETVQNKFFKNIEKIHNTLTLFISLQKVYFL